MSAIFVTSGLHFRFLGKAGGEQFKNTIAGAGSFAFADSLHSALVRLSVVQTLPKPQRYCAESAVCSSALSTVYLSPNCLMNLHHAVRRDRTVHRRLNDCD